RPLRSSRWLVRDMLRDQLAAAPKDEAATSGQPTRTSPTTTKNERGVSDVLVHGAKITSRRTRFGYLDRGHKARGRNLRRPDTPVEAMSADVSSAPKTVTRTQRGVSGRRAQALSTVVFSRPRSPPDLHSSTASLRSLPLLQTCQGSLRLACEPAFG